MARSKARRRVGYADGGGVGTLAPMSPAPMAPSVSGFHYVRDKKGGYHYVDDQGRPDPIGSLAPMSPAPMSPPVSGFHYVPGKGGNYSYVNDQGASDPIDTLAPMSPTLGQPAVAGSPTGYARGGPVRRYADGGDVSSPPPLSDPSAMFYRQRMLSSRNAQDRPAADSQEATPDSAQEDLSGDYGYARGGLVQRVGYQDGGLVDDSEQSQWVPPYGPQDQTRIADEEIERLKRQKADDQAHVMEVRDHALRQHGLLPSTTGYGGSPVADAVPPAPPAERPAAEVAPPQTLTGYAPTDVAPTGATPSTPSPVPVTGQSDLGTLLRRAGGTAIERFGQGLSEAVRPGGGIEQWLGTEQRHQAIKQGLADYVNGTNAIPPDQLAAHREATAAANPGASDGDVTVKMVTDPALSMDDKARVLQGHKNVYHSLINHALGAAAHNDWDTVAQLAQKAHDHVPDGEDLTFTPDERGMMVKTAHDVFRMNPQQVMDYLKGPATSFDHVLENGVHKNLAIASTTGQAPGAIPSATRRGDSATGFLAPEHLQRSQSYGINKPSSTAQARSDVAADRADARRNPVGGTRPPQEQPVYLPDGRPVYRSAWRGLQNANPAAGLPSGPQDPNLPEGAYRVARGTPTSLVPPTHHIMPAEDDSLGYIAMPRDVAPGMKNITTYTADGTPIPKRIPSYWDPSKIQYEGGGGGRESGRPVFANPPPGMGAGAGATLGGPSFAAQAPPWQPTFGPNVAGRPPPAGDESPYAQAQRLYPGTGQGTQRSEFAGKDILEQQKESTRTEQEAAKNRTAIQVQQMRNDGSFQTTLTKLASEAVSRNDTNAARMMATINAAIRSPEGWNELPPELKDYAQRLFTRFRSPQGGVAPAGGGAAPAPAGGGAAAAPNLSHIPPEAISFLRDHPQTAAQFDGMFGVPGAAASILGR